MMTTKTTTDWRQQQQQQQFAYGKKNSFFGWLTIQRINKKRSDTSEVS
jgi:hypothetical protein